MLKLSARIDCCCRCWHWQLITNVCTAEYRWDVSRMGNMGTRRIWIRFPQAEVENWNSLSSGITIRLNTEKEASLEAHNHFSHLRNVRGGILSLWAQQWLSLCQRPACLLCSEPAVHQCSEWEAEQLETQMWYFRALGKSCTAGVRQHCSLGFEELSFQFRHFRKWHPNAYVPFGTSVLMN